MKKHKRTLCLTILGSFLLNLLGGCNGSSSSPSGPTGTGDTTAPTFAGTVSAIGAIGSVQLSWPTATDNVAISGYRVTLTSPVFAARASTLTRVVDAATTSITWTGLAGGTPHTFSVVAFDTSNNPSSTLTASAIPLVLDTVPPDDVTNLTGGGGWNAALPPGPPNEVEINLSWTPPPNTPDLDRFLVCVESPSPAVPCDVLNASVPASVSLPITIGGPSGLPVSTLLQINTAYFVQIIAVDTSGNTSPGTGFGATATITPTQSTDVTPPSVVQNLRSVPGNGQVALFWDPPASADAAGYNIYARLITTPADFELIAWGAPAAGTTSISVVITQLSSGAPLVNGQSYEFMVLAFDAIGNESLAATTAPTSDDDPASKVTDTPTSDQIGGAPNFRGGVFPLSFYSGRNIVMTVSTAVPGLLNSSATTRFYYTLDGSNIDTTSVVPLVDSTHGFFDFAGADLGTNPNVVDLDLANPGHVYAVTIDFDPSTPLVTDRIDQNNLRPGGGPDHIILNYKIMGNGDASRLFTENYLVFDDSLAPPGTPGVPPIPNWVYKFSGMKVERYHPTATRIESGLTQGDIVVTGGSVPPFIGAMQGGIALNSGSRYRARFEHFETFTGTLNMAARRMHHQATLLLVGDEIFLSGGYNDDGLTTVGEHAANRSLGLITTELFRADPAVDGFEGVLRNLTEVRNLHTATRLFDGRILVAGGLNGQICPVGGLGAPVNDPQGTVPPSLNATASASAVSFVPDLNIGARTFVGGLVGEVIELLTSIGAPRSVAGGAARRAVITGSALDRLTGVQDLTVEGFDSPVAFGTPFRVIETDTQTAEVWNVAGTALDALQPLTTVSVDRYGHTATLLDDGTVFITGGSFNYAFDPDNPTRFQLSSEIFDPDDNRFESMGILADMTVTRYFHSATLLRDGKVLITGGVDRGDHVYRENGFVGASIRDTAEIFDPFTRETRVVGTMNRARVFHETVLLPSGNVLIVGGYTTVLEDGSLIREPSAEVFDPVSNTFLTLPDTLTFRGPVAVALIEGSNTPADGKVLVGGGATNTLAELFNESAARFDATAHGMSFDRFVGSVTTTLRDGTVLVTGGQTEDFLRLDEQGELRAGDYLDKVEFYDTSTVDFTRVADMLSPRRHHTATVMQDGTVLVAGGENESGGIAAVEIYDPVARTFTLTAPMLERRYKHTATLLPDGRLFVCGGAETIEALRSCEVYDPVNLRFTSVPPLAVGRFDHRATLLANGWVLITGGESIADTSVEIFDSTTDTFIEPFGGPLSMLVGRNGHEMVHPAYTLGRAQFANGLPMVVATGAGNAFGHTASDWSLVRAGDLVVSENQNVPYTVSAVAFNAAAVPPRWEITLTSNYTGQSTTTVLTGGISAQGFEYYTILSQDVYIAGGVVADVRTEVFLLATGVFSPGINLNQGRFGHALVSTGNLGMAIVGGRNPTTVEFTDAADTIFANDAWTSLPLDFGPLDFPKAFRVQNNMIITINQHSAQAYFDNL